MHKVYADGYRRLVVAHILAATTIGLIWVVVTHRRHKKINKSATHEGVVPRLDLTGSGHVGRLEQFQDYVARQIGFRDANECPGLCKLASDYVRSSRSFEDDIYSYFSNEKHVDAESLSLKLVEELERCILGYFAFHWNHASLMISQVLSVGSDEGKLKNMVLIATRKQRFEKVTKHLKVTRAFSTMVEEMKAIGYKTPKIGDGDDTFGEVKGPVAQGDRRPVILFMGGGMGAGKSTVLKEILKEEFWSRAAQNAVVVEADAFKETDVIYRALSSNGHPNDMLQTAELVHQTSTDAASSLLVTALNEGLDVIMDGTLSWEPFVEQTIAMVRSIHEHRYRMGVGYKVLQDGTIIEDYWERVEDRERCEDDEKIKEKPPYRIELVGVVCDPYLAVTRGIRRAIAVKRAVRVHSQLKSHKRFASAFPKYCKLVDNARLYCTNGIGVPPTLIEWKDDDSNLLDQIKCLETLREINDEADSIYDLYGDPKMLTESGSVWKEYVLKPDRIDLQRDLKVVIERIEKSKLEHAL
ncbi:calmodulin calcium-dependent NAD kinase-like [Bidens hawaiensis]|uniref:calmodulin calcium-dependent NAD kinase-like n=1 Tax=Bidens hawaiensis TaxID=980011 RepID=UPI00404A609F